MGTKQTELATEMIKSIYNISGIKLLATAMNNAFYQGEIIENHNTITYDGHCGSVMTEVYGAIHILKDVAAFEEH